MNTTKRRGEGLMGYEIRREMVSFLYKKEKIIAEFEIFSLCVQRVKFLKDNRPCTSLHNSINEFSSSWNLLKDLYREFKATLSLLCIRVFICNDKSDIIANAPTAECYCFSPSSFFQAIATVVLHMKYEEKRRNEMTSLLPPHITCILHL